MVLVVGGMAAGKLEYVMTRYGYSRQQVANGVLDDRPVLYNLQDMVCGDIDGCFTLLPQLAKKEIIICNEVGNGVIPVSGEDRHWREATGRLCIELARRADTVVRVVCGIPTVIKGA